MQIKGHEKRLAAVEAEMRDSHRAWRRDQDDLQSIHEKLKTVSNELERVRDLMDKLMLRQ